MELWVYNFLRQFDFGLWKLFEVIFDEKIWVAILVILTVFYFIKNRITKNPFAKILSSVILSGAITFVIKYIAGRARPILFENANVYGYFPFTNEWFFNSMPSGHTALSFAALIMASYVWPKTKYYMWTLAILIGLSRVMIGAHWPLDVIVGALVGWMSAKIINLVLRAKSKK